MFIPGCTHNRYSSHFQSIDSGELQFFPETYAEKPDLPSPAVDADGREVILVKIQDNLYTWFDATIPESLSLLVEALKHPDWND